MYVRLVTGPTPGILGRKHERCATRLTVGEDRDLQYRGTGRRDKEIGKLAVVSGGVELVWRWLDVCFRGYAGRS